MDELDADNAKLTSGGRIAERDIVQVSTVLRTYDTGGPPAYSLPPPPPAPTNTLPPPKLTANISIYHWAQQQLMPYKLLPIDRYHS